MRAPLLATAAVLIASALGLSHGSLGLRPLLLVAAGGACVAAAVALREEAAPAWAGRLAELVLGAGLAFGVLHDLQHQPGWHATHAVMPAFRPVLAAAAAVLATHLWPRAPAALARWRPAALAALWLVLVALVFRAFPAPTIDVWDLQQGAAAGLLRGENPYALTYPNRYGPGTTLLAKALLTPDGARIVGYPYPPLTFLAGLPAYLALGDVRWAHAALTLAAAAGIWQLGGRTRPAELAAALVLFQPSGYFLVEQAWTEPVLLAALVGLAHAVTRAPAGPWVAVAAGLAVASKQYAPLVALPFLAAVPAGARLRAAALAAAVAAATILPFAAWDPRALWHGLVEFQLSQPFRSDSLSVAAALHRWRGVTLPAWPGFLAAGLALALGWARARRPSGALAVAALAWLALIGLSKQAFANYYGLAVGLLCAAVAASAAEGRGPEPEG